MTQALCSDCSDDPESWSIDAPEGIPSVFWTDENGEKVDVPPEDDPAEHPELTKNIARECPDCGNYWEYTVE